MFAWLAGGALGGAWRRSARLVEAVPAPRAARWGGLAAALGYAAFAGWGVPAQRTALMLAVSTLLAGGGLHWPWPLVWGAAAVAVAAADPWALLQPGFWLSFVAVGLLLATGSTPGALRGAGTERPAGVGAASRSPAGATGGTGLPPRAPAAASALAAARRLIVDGLRTQAVATLGLAPLTLVFFQQLSLVGFAANLVAIPLVTLAITPLALLGVLLPPLWDVAAALVRALDALLTVLATPPWAVWTVAAAGPPAVALGLAGGALALLPLPRRVRALALALVLPLVLPPPSRPPWGRVDAMAVDVGQGGAVLIRTATHTMLYDAGPQYGSESDAGDRVLLPLLRALGERRLDVLMLSHRDTDHIGGADALLDALPVETLSSSLEPGHPLLARAARHGVAARRCGDGQRWQWDGVDFELLHPDAARFERAAASPRLQSNTLSCVLQVRERARSAPRVLLLPGDVERAQEGALVTRHGRRLASDVLLVPHHGSKTSSSAAFLDAVAPRVAVVQAGYRNRFGHPAPVVLQRLRERGIEVVQNADCGAWRLSAGVASCWRAVAPRYWRAEPAAAPAHAPGLPVR
jgi:competence protein ComEC